MLNGLELTSHHSRVLIKPKAVWLSPSLQKRVILCVALFRCRLHPRNMHFVALSSGSCFLLRRGLSYATSKSRAELQIGTGSHTGVACENRRNQGGHFCRSIRIARIGRVRRSLERIIALKAPSLVIARERAKPRAKRRGPWQFQFRLSKDGIASLRSQRHCVSDCFGFASQ